MLLNQNKEFLIVGHGDVSTIFEKTYRLCRTLTEEPDLLNRVISSLENAVLDEIVGRQRKKPLNPAELSESFVGAIAELLIEAFSMSRTFAGSLVERHYAGFHAPA